MSINRTELKTALEKVKPGLANREIIEQSNSFAFMDGRVITYNDEVSVSHPVGGLLEGINGAIKAEELYNLLAKIKGDEIELIVDGNEIRLSSGRVKAGLTFQAEVTLPLGEIGKTGKWKKLPEKFLAGLKFAVVFTSRETSKPVLTCVNVTSEGLLQSSNNFAIFQYNLEEEMPVKTFLIPYHSVGSVLNLKPTQIAEGDGWIHFKTEQGTVLSCRVFDEKFPDVEPLLDVEGVCVAFPERIDSMLDKATVFSKNDVSSEENVLISFKGNKLTVSSKNDVGWVTETAKLEKPLKEDFEFEIVASMLKGILNETHEAIISDNLMKCEGENWVYILSLK